MNDEDAPAAPPVSLSLDELLSDTSAPPVHSSSHSHAATSSARKGAGHRHGAAADPARRAQKALNLALATLLVGGLAAGLVWISFVGPVMGAIGIAVGMVGIAAATSKSKLPLALDMVGLAFSLVGIGLGGYLTWSRSQAPVQVAAVDPASTPAAKAPEAAATDANKKLAGPTSNSKTGDTGKRDIPGKDNSGKTKPGSGAKTTNDKTPASRSGLISKGSNSSGATKGSSPAATAQEATDSTNTGSDDKDPKNKDPNDKDPKNGAAGDKQSGAAKPPSREVLKAGSIPIFVQDPSDPAPAAGSDPAMSADGASGTPAAPAAIAWAAADKGEAQTNDDLEVTVARVTLGTAVLSQAGATNELLAQTRETAQPYLTVWLKVKNAQLAGSTEYKGWINQPAAAADAPKLVDDHGHVLTQMPMEKGMMILNAHPTATIAAGNHIEDALIYRPAAEGVQYLRLTLPGKVLGTTGVYHFQIPISMVTSGMSTNPLLPSQ